MCWSYPRSSAFIRGHLLLFTLSRRRSPQMGLSYEFMPIDPSALVAPTAIVSPDAVVGPAVRIGEFCVIERDVVLGARCVLDPYVYMKRWPPLGEPTQIAAGTALGTDPLDRNFDGGRSYLRIG